MAPIPTSDMPGYKHLHERVITALDRCQESQGVEFKESASWESLKWQLIRTTMAMGNLRDGGIVVIGVSERGETYELTGVLPEHLNTYDVDIVIDVINAYCSPYIDIDLVLVEYSNRQRFLTIQAHQFNDTPLVCKKNGPNGLGLVEGDVFVRPPGMARTTKITNAAQMHDLLELAGEKRARRILEVSRRVGLMPSATSADLFERELGGL